MRSSHSSWGSGWSLPESSERWEGEGKGGREGGEEGGSEGGRERREGKR